MIRLEPTQHRASGFTLVEMLVVIVITAFLFGLISVNLGRPQQTANVTTSVDTLLTDIKAQQILAMAGDKGSSTSAQPHGLYLQNNKYTLFAGSTYNAGDSYNFTVNLPTGAQVATTFPSTQLIFSKGDGSVQGFVNGSNTITLTSGTTTRTITVNRFGALTVN